MAGTALAAPQPASVDPITAQGGALTGDYGFIIPVDGDVSTDYGFIIPVDGQVGSDYGFIIPVEGQVGADYGFIIPVAGDVDSDYGFIIPVGGDVAPDYGFIIPVAGDVDGDYGFIIPVEGDIASDYGFIIPVGGDLEDEYGFIIPVDGGVDGEYGFIIPVGGDVDGDYGFIIPVQGELGTDYGFIIPVDGALAGEYGFIIPVDDSGVSADYGFIIPVDGDVAGNYGFIIPVGGDAAPDYGFIIPVDGDLSNAYGFIIPVDGSDAHGVYATIQSGAGDVTTDYGFIIPVDGEVNGAYGFIIPVDQEGIAGQYGFIIPVEGGGLTGSYGFIIPVEGSVDPDYGFIIPVSGEIIPEYGFIIPVIGDVDPDYGFIIPVAEQTVVADYGFIIPVDGVEGRYGFIIPVAGGVTENYGAILPGMDEILPDYGFIIPVEGDERADLGVANPEFGYIIPDYGFIIPVDGEYQVVAEADVDADYGFIIPVQGEVAPYYGFIIPVDGMDDVFPTAQPVAGPNLVDHWMAGARYSPVVSAAAGAGEGVTVGLLDFTPSGNADVLDAIVFSDGISSYESAHGAGVASLIVGGRYGFGVSGLAQRADLAVFNPFDATESTNFEDSGQGLEALAAQGASVINMSLGVENYVLAPEWADVLTSASLSDTVIVKAAGNDGAVHADDVEWTGKFDNLILVGSVGPDGTISDFSNTPGTACLTAGGTCRAGGDLMDRFIVAPGEQITVADGEGGLLLASGTSLATPIVTGAVALLHSRWPWLAKNPEASTEIIFASARDVGAEGVDEVYGHGLLDVAASQRPLDGYTLTTSPLAKSRTIYEMNMTQTLSAARIQSWAPVGGTRTVFEKVGTTYRDFVLPLTLDTLSQVANARGTDEEFENTFIDFSASSFAPRLDGEAPEGVFGFGSYGAQTVVARSGLRMNFSIAPTRSYFRTEGEANVDAAVSLANSEGTLSFTMGRGAGALALSGTDTLAAPQDTDLLTGGVNPVLGLASGDAFLGSQMQLADGLELRFGASTRDFAASRYTDLGAALRANFTPLDDYEASAMTVGARYGVATGVKLGADLTYLNESNAVLGVQSREDDLFGAGSETYALTGGAEFDLGGFSLDLSATTARTRAGEGGALAFSGGEFTSTAYQVALAKTGVLGAADRVRVSVAQPLHVDAGEVTYRGYEVVDRATGEIGLVDQTLGIDGGDRTHVVEALYGARILDGAGELNAFARGEFGLDERQAGGDKAVTVGAAFAVSF
ncbi:hypothetical protein B5C34_13025 [Pacificimonas flava]|uniref:Peptidase S8/S53 domain-containing protein n=2 Tax=Pacificimonas TaxID=1960290 RepID=A0A219B905_9SPHN|nr:hypothetical protein B5C34_13025 [Pacificimonas flava]